MKRHIFSLLFGALCAFSLFAESPIRRVNGPEGALSGRNIALWQSHGSYFDQSESRWKWQRCRLFGTVEDLYTRSYVVPFLVPMLENAGAYVMLPRERDESTFELIIDPDGAAAHHGYTEHNGSQKWKDDDNAAFGLPDAKLLQGDNPFTLGHARTVKAPKKPKDKESVAQWHGPIDVPGTYAVYASWVPDPQNSSDAVYTIYTSTGPQNVIVDQTRGGKTWMYLGSFHFEEGDKLRVSLSNRSESGGNVSADAIRIGGGVGSVARSPLGSSLSAQTSGLPRWAEGARYWLQWAGMPDSVYSHQEGADDYRDDIFARPMWVNYLLEELHIPIDLVMAFHSDAGIEPGDSIVGTLGIYYTQKNGKFKDGRSRKLSGRLAESIVNSVVNDIRSLYEPEWVKRPMRDKSYIEARIPEVPSMLLELLSHQNLADMRYGLDPQFKFDVSRAVYKGILKYLSSMGLAKYIVTPLPPTNFSIEGFDGNYTLRWASNPDPLEPTAAPTHYYIEERRGSDPTAPFVRIGQSRVPSFKVKIERGEVVSYRLIAANEGGESFPGEILAAGWSRAGAPTVTVVNGFTRLSAPDSFHEGSMAGFGISDPGVPAGVDYSYTGRQFEFDTSLEWSHDDAPGFGASYSDMETKPVYGNSFDFVATHGEAILAANRSFVSSSVDAFVADSLFMPEAVDLILGLQRETKVGVGNRPAAHRAFPADLQWRLRSLADIGVPMMISGAYIGNDLWNSPSSSPADRSFAREVLGFEWRTGNATSVGKLMEVSSPYFNIFSNGTFMFNMEIGQQPFAVTSPDAIYPASASGSTVMRYVSGQCPAAVAFAPLSHRVFSMGIPFEAIETPSMRAQLMKQILQFLEK